MPAPPPTRLVLASTSPYRRELLGRLQVPFTCCAPEVDEAVTAGATARDTVLRLARAKAAAGARLHPSAFVIGSDQVATLDGQIVSKPGSHAAARAQLRAASGRTIRFDTAICVRAPDGREASSVAATDVTFRILSDDVIETYLDAEKPYDCAGAFKVEGLGIALLASVDGPDPTALIGLPLMAVVDHLAALGLQLFDLLPQRGNPLAQSE